MPKMNLIERVLLDTRLNRPYYSVVLATLSPQPCASIPTLAVSDQYVLYYNPDYLEDLYRDSKCVVAIEHEISHLLRNHFKRAKSIEADPGLFNVAGDLEINDDLVEIPPEWLHPNQYGLPLHATAEHYYDKLQSENHRKPDIYTCCAGGSGAGRPLPIEANEPDRGITSHDHAKVQKATARLIKEHAAKNRGDVPDRLVMWADAQLISPPIDWRTELQQTISKSRAAIEIGRQDYSYKRLSRRWFHKAPLRPGLVSYRPSAAIIVDTSASMAGLGSEVVTLVQSAMATINATIISCDAAVQTVSLNRRHVIFKGGGGTDLRCAFEAANKLQHDLIIVITDGETPWPAPVEVPTVVINLGDGEVPRWVREIKVRR